MRMLSDWSGGEFEEVIKVALVVSVLQDELATHKALMQSWAGDMFDLWNTLYESLPESHLWFQLVKNLPLPPIVGDPDPEDTSDFSINEEDEPENNVEGNEDEVNSALMESILNVAINNTGNPNGQC
ncbi:hypothetical protein PCASD_25932 [Puccinia coronata f. sp. avenae]|uniref:Uncharacterized protein n=1 Tax=Puccinia coronata f. sp. avenae TaxID=200324 RepID=A0A2N5TQZ9_9BASI|nr:hypothetical protein PCASD_25932 [Puccinia coronata f. sp. avenae]